MQEIPLIISYKELLRNLVLRDIKKRYKRSALGFLWVMLDPLLMMLIFYIIFAGIFKRTIDNYTAYVMAGIIMWQLFSQGTKVASTAFIHNRDLINKLYLPKSIFPISNVASSLAHFIFALIPLFIIMIFSGTAISHNIVLLPFIVMLIFLFSIGISLTVSTLTVFFHDVIYIYEVLLMGWMYFSAIFYPVSILPEKLQFLMSLNPVYHYITLFRACLYDNTLPLTEHFVFGAVFALLSFSIGWVIYNKNKEKIIFYL
ncbi:MAG: ABC transporter permease [Nitrospirae bacterium]|jgi:ABC-type polysaccharide/polyol phosphate export permease|nr:ABC transporter permease [Nitrospirota bacterium]